MSPFRKTYGCSGLVLTALLKPEREIDADRNEETDHRSTEHCTASLMRLSVIADLGSSDRKPIAE